MVKQRSIAPTEAQERAVGSWRLAAFGSDAVFRETSGLAAFTALVVAGLTIGTLWFNSRGAMAKYGWAFLSSDVWDPNIKLAFGAQSNLFGTVGTSVIALLSAGFVIARVAGETAPLIFTPFGNNNDFLGLTQPTPTLSSRIFVSTASLSIRRGIIRLPTPPCCC